MNKDSIKPTQQSITQLFAQDKHRFQHFSLEAAEFFLDYSKNRITTENLQQLIQVAHESHLTDAIEQQFSGKLINHTEQRAALHTALRDSSNKPIYIHNDNVKPMIQAAQQRMQQFVEAVRAGQYLGVNQQPITDVINLGIGGSHFGPAMAYKALSDYHDGPNCHFIAYLDETYLKNKLKRLNPATTLVLIVSKSFTTAETLTNAQIIKNWLGEATVAQQCLAITANAEQAQAFGVNAENIFPIWSWVGGRYSLWSAVGMSLALAIGVSRFRELLAGAETMDQHFRNAEFSKNMPVILGLLAVWYNNFFNAQTQAIIPYSHRLSLLPDYLQQSHMESLGKHVDLNGHAVENNTGAIIWGGEGTSSQHSFHQLLMQGTHLVPVDFILPLRHHPEAMLNKQLIANCFAQSQTLMQGYQPAESNMLSPHQMISGNMPSNTIVLEALTPKTLGALIALYEHKIFVQSVLWNINAYDQWGVERGKVLAKSILADIETGEISSQDNASTRGLFNRLKQKMHQLNKVGA